MIVTSLLSRMSAPRKYKLKDVFSCQNLQATKKYSTDLYETSVYLSNASNPAITSLRFGKKQRRSTLTGKWSGIVTTYDCQSISYIATILKGSPSACVTMLLGGFCHKVEAIFVVLDTSESIKRSATIDMSWCRRMWSVFSKAHLIAITSVYYSVLGGAYCSLGKSNSKYAYKAGILAVEQIKLAQRLKDPILECKCWLYFAEDLIQLGKLKTAKKIIKLQRKFVQSLQEDTLVSMLDAVVGKMNSAITLKTVNTVTV
ncbi:unnamed protein product [Mucor hiemalis]